MSGSLSMLMLIGGCVYLLIGGDFLVRGALALSRRTAISPMVVGLTVVAFGTSAPELIVSLFSALNGYPGLAIGNVVGSNIANVLLVVGVPALIYPMLSSEVVISRQAIFMLLVTIVFMLMCVSGNIERMEAWILLAILTLGILLTIKTNLSVPGIDIEDAEEQLQRVLGLPQNKTGIALLIFLGCVFLPVGADLTVDGSVALATLLGVNEAVIGSTLVALGTSLPELSSTLTAAFRRSAEMALGNVIGSNVMNILLIIGVTALFVELPVPEIYLFRELWIMLGSSVLLTIYIFRRQAVGKLSGMAFLVGYIIFCLAIF